MSAVVSAIKTSVFVFCLNLVFWSSMIGMAKGYRRGIIDGACLAAAFSIISFIVSLTFADLWSTSDPF